MAPIHRVRCKTHSGTQMPQEGAIHINIPGRSEAESRDPLCWPRAARFCFSWAFRRGCDASRPRIGGPHGPCPGMRRKIAAGAPRSDLPLPTTTAHSRIRTAPRPLERCPVGAHSRPERQRRAGFFAPSRTAFPAGAQRRAGTYSAGNSPLGPALMDGLDAAEIRVGPGSAALTGLVRGCAGRLRQGLQHRTFHCPLPNPHCPPPAGTVPRRAAFPAVAPAESRDLLCWRCAARL